MKSIECLMLLEALRRDTEKHLEDTIRIFQNLKEEELLRPSVSGGWSIVQCLEHLNTYADYYHPLLKKGLTLQHNSTAGVFKSTWLGAYFTRIMRPENNKKYKAYKAHIPAINLDAYAVVAAFIQHQEELLNYLKEAEHADLNRIRIPVSIIRLVRLKAGDVFQFLIAHNERHIRQAKRNLE